MSIMTLAGKTVWLTGASSGIGEALAIALSAAGCRLILTARSAEKLAAVQARCTEPQRHCVVPMDLTAVDEIATRAVAVLAEHGPVDILINNAGIGQRASVLETSLAVERQIMTLNYFAVAELTRAVLPHLLQRPQAMVVSVASVMGKFATPRRSAYCASKHAVVAFMDALRAELHGSAVIVLTVCPGYINTPFSLAALKGDGTPQGHMDPGQLRGMAPSHCAEAIVKAMQKQQAELWVGGKEIFGVYLKQLCPPLLRQLVSRVRVT